MGPGSVTRYSARDPRVAGGESGNAGLSRYAENRSFSILILQPTVPPFMTFFSPSAASSATKCAFEGSKQNQLAFEQPAATSRTCDVIKTWLESDW